ncbi:SGNH/GDSL hydrolase family protein [Streptomyces salinarius]|uniref:hypothetical protein n=1 Tax=Streptomyces salinarius TaxID=2762598 RepID=UPI0016447561|nr:hypothetical protein [Streptomyces salinarius]
MIQSNSGELPQVEEGYLDQNTSLVTISIGGNDSRFADVIQKRLVAIGDGSCANKTFESGDSDSHVGGRDTKYVGKPLPEAIPGSPCCSWTCRERPLGGAASQGPGLPCAA